MTCEDKYQCPECETVLEKQLSTGFYVAGGMKPTLDDLREENHHKKVKDWDRAVKMRKKAFGVDSLGNPEGKSDPRHIIKKGRVLDGQQKEIDRQDFIKAAAKSDYLVEQSLKVLKNKNK